MEDITLVDTIPQLPAIQPPVTRTNAAQLRKLHRLVELVAARGFSEMVCHCWVYSSGKLPPERHRPNCPYGLALGLQAELREEPPCAQ